MISKHIFTSDVVSGKQLYINGLNSTGDLIVASTDFDIENNLKVGADLSIGGNSVLSGNANISGDLYVDQTFTAKGAGNFHSDLTVGGDLTVNGTTTTVNSTTLTVHDKNIELGSLDTPTNTTADGGGITLKGTTDKEFKWTNTSNAWNSSEHLGIADGKYLFTDKVRARDGAGLFLEDDGGNGIFVQDGGNVGIGTTSPDHKLHVDGGDIKISSDAGTSNGDGLPSLLFCETTNTGNEACIVFNGDLETGEDNYLGFGVYDITNPLEDTLAEKKLRTTLHIRQNGNVGIGTTSPSETLHVEGGSNESSRLAVTRGDISRTAVLAASADDPACPYVGSHTNDNFAIYTNNSAKMLIHKDGNVGIGTTSPAQLLHVNSSPDVSSARIRVQNGEGYAEIATDGTDGFLTAAGAEVLRFDSAGNVGIGTTEPNRKLGVQGVQGWLDSSGAERAALNPAADGVDLQLRDSSGNEGPNSAIRFDSRPGGNSWINNGNVGIGTASPSSSLHVKGATLGDNAGDETSLAEIQGARHRLLFRESRHEESLSGNNWDGVTYKLQKKVDSTNMQSINFVHDSGAAAANNHIDLYVGGHTSSAPFLSTRFAGNGKVGIGTTTPNEALHVNGNIQLNNWVRTIGDMIISADFDNNNNDSSIRFNIDGNNLANEKMRIASDGNVGIGTISPKLNANGGRFLTLQGIGANAWLELATTSQTDNLGGAISFNNTNISGTDKRVAQISSLRNGANNKAHLNFSTNNGSGTAERMRIDSSGNVGIGTTSPADKLHVSTGSNSDQGNIGFTIGGSSASNARTATISKNTSNPYELTIQAGNHSDANVATIFKASDATETMRIAANTGNVGIGTTSPNAKLDIVNTSTTTTQSYGLSVQGGGNSTGQGYSFRALGLHGSTDFFVRGDGNVGIGTDSPNYKLDVDGTIKSTGLNILKTEANTYSGSIQSLNTGLTLRNTLDTDGELQSIGINFALETTGNSFTRSSWIGSVQDQSDSRYSSLVFGTDEGTSAQPNRTEKMRISYDGNVGIGTDSPSAKLEVDGSVKIKGDLHLDSNGGFISLKEKHTGAELFDYLHARTNLINITGTLTNTTKASAHTETFTVPSYPSATDNNPDTKGVRYYIKLRHTDAEAGIRFAINNSPDFTLHYRDADSGNSVMNDNSHAWSTFDITDYMQQSNTLYFWASSGDGGGIYERFVFASAGIALPNEPVEQNQVFAQGLTSFGNVGIGTPSPDFLLDLVQKDGGVQLQMGRSNTSAGSAWMGADSTGFHLGVGTYAGIAESSAFAIDSNGNVGIGTTEPDGKLEVSSDNFDTLYLNRNENTGSSTVILKNNAGSGGALQSINGGGLKFLNRDNTGTLTPTQTIDSSGNVGIGTTSPDEALHVKTSTPAVQILAERGNDQHALFSAKNSRTSDNQVYFGITPGGNFGIGHELDVDANGSFFIQPDGKVTVSNVLQADGGMTIATNEDVDTPELTLKRYSSTNASGSDDIVDIRVADSSLNFIINNDSDQDAGTYNFTKMANGVTVPAAISCGTITTNDIIRKNGDSNTYLEFHSADRLRLVTGGVQQLEVTNSGLFIQDNIKHTGDPNTYFGFHNSDQWRVVTGGSERLEVTNTAIALRRDTAITGGLTISGDLTVNGDTVTLNTTNLEVEDKLVTVAKNATNAATANNCGLDFGGQYKLTFRDESTNKLVIEDTADNHAALEIQGFGGSQLILQDTNSTNTTNQSGVVAWKLGDDTVTAEVGFRNNDDSDFTIRNDNGDVVLLGQDTRLTGTGNLILEQGNLVIKSSSHGGTLSTATLTTDRAYTLPNKSGTVAMTSDIGNGAITITAGAALTGGGSFDLNRASAKTITINHQDTSSQGSSNNSGRTYIQNISLDSYGHVTSIGTATETVVNTNTQRTDAEIRTAVGGSFPSFGTAQNGKVLKVSGGNLSWQNDNDSTTNPGGSDHQVQFNNNGSFGGSANLTFDGTNLSCAGDVVSYASSDKKLKNNISNISSPIEKIKQINGVNFEWSEKQSVYTGKDVGVLAQDVEKVLPEVVSEREDGYLAVKYEKIIPLLIEAIKDQQKEIEELKSKLS